MSSSTYVLNKVEYQLVTEPSLLPRGQRAWQYRSRSSRGEDPSRRRVAPWKLHGPFGKSREGDDGSLGVDYAVNLETRYKDLVTSVAERNTLTLSTLDPPVYTAGVFGGVFGGMCFGPAYAVANASHFDEDRGQLFVHRGRATTQVDPAAMTVVETTLHEAAVEGAAAWQDRGIIGLGSSAQARRRRTVSATAGSTYEALAVAGSPIYAKDMAVGTDRLWLVQGDPTEQAVNEVRYTLDGFNSISNSFPVGDSKVPATGIGTVGPFAIVGSEIGASSFTVAGKPVRLIESLRGDRHAENGKHVISLWGWTYITTIRGLKGIILGDIENDVGPEANRDFEGDIDGYPTALWAYKGSLFAAYKTTAGHLHVLRGELNPRTTPYTGVPDWYSFLYVASTLCDVLASTGRRTRPTVIVGEGTNISWFTLGNRGRDIADSGYRFNTSGGTLYGSTLTRDLGLHKHLRQAVLISENCDASNYWRLAVSLDGGAYVNVGDTITTNGHQILYPVSGGVPLTTVGGHTIKPRLTQVAASATLPPQLRGVLELTYDERPPKVVEHVLVTLVNETERAALLALANEHAALVEFYRPDDTTLRYGFVTSVDGGGDIRGDAVGAAAVTVLEWTTS